ncbi:MAG: hypothetical protein WBP26_05180 [Candidatus Saccharimonadales bacterium]
MAKKTTKKTKLSHNSASMFTINGTLIIVAGVIFNLVAPSDNIFRALSMLVILFGAVVVGVGLGIEMAKTKKH